MCKCKLNLRSACASARWWWSFLASEPESLCERTWSVYADTADPLFVCRFCGGSTNKYPNVGFPRILPANYKKNLESLMIFMTIRFVFFSCVSLLHWNKKWNTWTKKNEWNMPWWNGTKKEVFLLLYSKAFKGFCMGILVTIGAMSHERIWFHLNSNDK